MPCIRHGAWLLYKSVRVTSIGRHVVPACRVQQNLLADDCEQRRQGGAEYELTATVSHHGRTPASGHYTADVKQPDGEWLRFDDDYVSHVNLPAVLSRDTETYLLFYEMKPRT